METPGGHFATLFYFGGHIGEVRKLIDFVVSDSFGGLVLTLLFASGSFLAKALGGQDHVEET